jgi:hypothetical protein
LEPSLHTNSTTTNSSRDIQETFDTIIVS